jgi:pimeloyl-ACP methyl ester carboxylesterase
MDSTPSIVLVHGAWGSPVMWDWVIDELGPLGSATKVADLPTMQRPDATLADDVAHVREVAGDGPTILCGHSYGGAVITEAGAAVPGLAHLLYLAAFVPDVGEDVFTWTSKRSFPDAPPLDIRDDGTGIPTMWGEREDTDPLTRERLGAIPPRPLALASAVTPLTAAAWRETPSTYVVATRDRVVHPDTQREFAARATTVVDIESDHMLNLAHPAEIAALLSEIAAAQAS